MANLIPTGILPVFLRSIITIMVEITNRVILKLLFHRLMHRLVYFGKEGILAAWLAGVVSYNPVTNTTNAVAVHTIKVSTIFSNKPHRAWRTGWSVMAEECAIGAVPIPDSLEYTPLAVPHLMA